MTMPKRKAKTYPSRAKVCYAAIPREYAKLLKELALDGAKHEKRSMAFLVTLAVRRFLEAEGLVDAKGKVK